MLLLFFLNYLNVANSSRSFSSSCVTKCCDRISDDRWATLRANVTTCDSSRWNRLFIPYCEYKFSVREIGGILLNSSVLTLMSLIFRRSSIRRRSRIGRPLIELDGSDDRLPWRRRMPAPRVRNDSCKRPGKLLRVPSIWNINKMNSIFQNSVASRKIQSGFHTLSTSPYICSRPSSCERICRIPWVSVSESLTDWAVPHAPPSNDSKSNDRVVFDVKSLSKPKTDNGQNYSDCQC